MVALYKYDLPNSIRPTPYIGPYPVETNSDRYDTWYQVAADGCVEEVVVS